MSGISERERRLTRRNENRPTRHPTDNLNPSGNSVVNIPQEKMATAPAPGPNQLALATFNGSGWVMWSRQARFSFIYQDVWGIINGEELPPTDPALLPAYKHRQAKATVLLNNALVGAPALLTRHLDAATEMWRVLKEKYEVVTAMGRQRAELAWREAHFPLGGDGVQYYEHLIQLASKLEDVGVPVSEAEMKRKLVDGLPEVGTWEHTKFGLYSTYELSTLEGLREKIAELAIKHKALDSNKASAPYGANAIQTTNNNNNNGSRNKRKKPPGGYICYNCNKPGHLKRECPQPISSTNQNRNQNNQNNNSSPNTTNGGTSYASTRSNTNNNRGNYKGKNFIPNYRHPNAKSAPQLPSNSQGENLFFNNQVTSMQATSVLAAAPAANSSQPTLPPLSWLIDSGCEAHMTGNQSLLSSMQGSEGGSVRAAGGSLYPIMGKGTCLLQVSSSHTLVLNDVLFVPGLGDNLLSQTMLEDSGASFSTHNGIMTISHLNTHMCVNRIGKSYRILDHTVRMSAIFATSVPSFVIPTIADPPTCALIDEGSEELICSLKCALSTEKFANDILESKFSSVPFSFAAVDEVATLDETDNTLTRKDIVPGRVGRRPKHYVKPPLVALRRQDQGGEPVSVRLWRLWHRRMGHPSDAKLQQLSRVVTGVSIPPKPEGLSECLICHRSKSTAGVRPSVASPSEYASGLIHMDTIGPISVPGRQGERYVLGIVDDTSRFATTYCINSKEAATQQVINYCQERKAQGKSVSHLRTDNAGELISRTLTAQLRSFGIHVTPIPPHSQWMNGVAERFNGSIMSIVRSLLSDSELPLMFWTDAVNHATRIYNRKPHT